tara:strand:+ start:8073 stop:8807 length:735 start_codon:yes stop_codon:yes gene_type:complete
MGKNIKKNSIRDNLKTILYAVCIAVVIRTFFLQPFTIPSGSMLPNLLVGDYLFVSKYSYGYSKYSIPFSPNLFNNRIISSVPKRGDVVVFRLPKDTNIDYIKRVIGLPGDEIQVKNGRLYLNKEELTVNPYKENIKYLEQNQLGHLHSEQLGDKSYVILDTVENSIGDNTSIYIVPDEHYFFMGDNRDNSLDSRFIDRVGLVPHENLIGRAEFLFFSSDKEIKLWKFWKWHKKFRWDRIFQKIE